MPKDYKLESLKKAEEDAFRKKQDAWQRYATARDRTNIAYKELQKAKAERNAAYDEMNREYERKERAWELYRSVWGEYSRIKSFNGPRIDQLRAENEYEHQAMQDAFEQAHSEYEFGDKSMASYYSEQGHAHKERRNDLGAEISQLAQEIKSARAYAEQCAPSKPDSSAFQSARERFMAAKSYVESVQAEFNRLKAERDAAKSEFDSAQRKWAEAKEASSSRLTQIKDEQARERERTLDKAGVSSYERRDAKIVRKADGTTQVYHGGLGKGDGFGHGHTALDQFGNKTYDRGAFEAHGHQNFADDKSKSSGAPITGGIRRDGNRRGKGRNIGGGAVYATEDSTESEHWTKLTVGTIIRDDGTDHHVWFRQGIGECEGQTLIRDYHDGETPKDFHEGHNHYGLSDREKYPNEPEYIEDGSRHKDDHYYTGPNS